MQSIGASLAVIIVGAFLAFFLWRVGAVEAAFPSHEAHYRTARQRAIAVLLLAWLGIAIAVYTNGAKGEWAIARYVAGQLAAIAILATIGLRVQAQLLALARSRHPPAQHRGSLTLVWSSTGVLLLAGLAAIAWLRGLPAAALVLAALAASVLAAAFIAMRSIRR